MDDKICASCGRRFSWRRKWAASWDEVRYCSDACRRRRIGSTDRALTSAIVRAVTERRSTTPEQAAADVAAEGGHASGAGELREAARRAARRLAAAGEVEIVQRGRAVDAASVRGPFEIRAGTSDR